MELKDIAILLINTLSFSMGYTFIAYSILENIMSKKNKLIKMLGVLFCGYLIISILFIFAGIPCMAFLLYIYLYIQRIPFIKNIICCIFTTIMIILVMICLNAVGNLFGMSSVQMVELRETIQYNIYSSIICVLISFLFAILIKYIGNKFPNIKKLSVK